MVTVYKTLVVHGSRETIARRLDKRKILTSSFETRLNTVDGEILKNRKNDGLEQPRDTEEFERVIRGVVRN